jgi:hypothetical protein
MGEIGETIETGTIDARTEGGDQDRGTERINGGTGAGHRRGTGEDIGMARGVGRGTGGIGSARRAGRGIGHGEVSNIEILMNAPGDILICLKMLLAIIPARARHHVRTSLPLARVLRHEIRYRKLHPQQHSL